MRKLLIVDDSTDLIYGMQRLLTFYDFNVRVAKDHKTLMNELESFKPEIILIDVLLGGEDGREICRALRETLAFKQLTIILFSASSKYLENFQEAGADGAIQKPFEITDLINQIKFAVLHRKNISLST